jgi:hypothetical protein
VAQIAFYDIGFQSLCGCNEGPATAAGATVTCTVPAGTTVFFHYTAAKVPHQLVSTPGGGSSFVSGPVYDPISPIAVRTFAARFDTSGTYTFQDAYDSFFTGQIVVP